MKKLNLEDLECEIAPAGSSDSPLIIVAVVRGVMIVIALLSSK